jgi:type VI protein secretion system component VasF
MRLMFQAATQQLYSALLATVPQRPELETDPRPVTRDRGAVSLEQVLWFIAVGVSVAVVATILWTQVIDTAEETDNIIQPTTP